MSGVIYSLCAISAVLCAVLLLRAYFRSKYRLLLWSGFCFAGLALNNTILVVDKIVVPNLDLSLLRTVTALVAMLILLYGMIWDAEG
jgi:Family of unknown function (DUF5985)